MLATLRRSGGIDALARHLGVAPPAVDDVAQALLPIILGGFRLRFDEPVDGLGGLREILGEFGGGAMAVELLSPAPADAPRGWRLTDRVLGGRDVAEAVVAHVAATSGQPVPLLGAALPLLVMLVGGYLGARADSEGVITSDDDTGIAELLGHDGTANALTALIAVMISGRGAR